MVIGNIERVWNIVWWYSTLCDLRVYMEHYLVDALLFVYSFRSLSSGRGDVGFVIIIIIYV